MEWRPSRRDVLRAGGAAFAAFGFGSANLFAQAEGREAEEGQEAPLQTRQIPSTGERLPVIGLGSANTFNVGESEEERAPLREVLRLFHEEGGRLFDTAPTYGTSEQVAASLARELGIHQELFLATKVSTLLSFLSPQLESWGREEGVRQQRESATLWDRDVIDLNQVHNLQGAGFHLDSLRRAKDEGRLRYLGVTVQTSTMYPDLEAVLRNEDLDFIQVNYSLGEPEAAERVLPLAADRGVAVIVNKPYNGGALFQTVRGHAVPDWAGECRCESWGQLFLKYILGYPAVTAVIPATSKAEHLLDNMGAGRGPLPDEALRRRLEEHVAGL